MRLLELLAVVKVRRQASSPEFYDVQSGSVTIGGVDVRNIEKRELMKRVAFVISEYPPVQRYLT